MADDQDDSQHAMVALVKNVIGTAINGLTPVVVKNLAKSMTRLCTALVDYPVVVLEGLVNEKRVGSEYRVKLIESAGKQLVKKTKVDPEYVKLASDKYTQRIVRERLNVDETVAVSIDEIANNSSSEGPVAGEISLIGDDWLNVFEAEASNMSSRQMQLLFGKILAGEIRKPSTYSIKTLKTMAQLDGRAAAKFKQFCGLVISNWPTGTVADARIVAIGDNSESNALADYGFDYGTLNMLFEYGLISSDYHAYYDYQGCVAQPTTTFKLRFQGKSYILTPNQGREKVSALRLHGPALSTVGREILPIIDVDPVPAYEEKLRQYFISQRLSMTEVK